MIQGHGFEDKGSHNCQGVDLEFSRVLVIRGRTVRCRVPLLIRLRSAVLFELRLIRSLIMSEIHRKEVRHFQTKSIEMAIDDIHENPVRRGLCRRAIDWKWSSAGELIAGHPRLLGPTIAQVDFVSGLIARPAAEEHC